MIKRLLWIALLWLLSSPVQASDRCAAFDSWIGGDRYALTVDKFGQMNVPTDTQLSTKILFPKSSIWRYYSMSTDTAYIVVFLDTDVDLSADQRAGATHVCAYEIAGEGMKEPTPPMEHTEYGRA